MTAVNIIVQGSGDISSIGSGSEIVSQPKTVYPFAETVDIVIVMHRRDKLNELVLVNKFAPESAEENVASGFSDH
jgi:hypothetical protein